MSTKKSKQQKKIEGAVRTAADTLNVNLPSGRSPLVIRLIALLTLVGGLSITGAAFADIFRPGAISAVTYSVRIASGLAFIVIAWGITTRKRWALWVYGVIAVIGLLVNPVVALLPAAVVVFLATQRNLFEPSWIDHTLKKYVGSKLFSDTKS